MHTDRGLGARQAEGPGSGAEEQAVTATGPHELLKFKRRLL